MPSGAAALFSSEFVTKDGSDRVSALLDASGNARDVAQATGTAQPLWEADEINGRPALSFDGGDFFGDLAFALTGTAMTSFHVVNYTSIGAYHNLYENTTASPMLWFDTSDNIEADTSSGAVSPSSHADTWITLTVTHQNGQASVIRVDGTQVDSGGTPTIGESVTLTMFNRGGASGFQGQWAFGAFYPRLLTAAEIAMAENTLRARYATW